MTVAWMTTLVTASTLGYILAQSARTAAPESWETPEVRYLLPKFTST